jgi:hypothetical protein
MTESPQRPTTGSFPTHPRTDQRSESVPLGNTTARHHAPELATSPTTRPPHPHSPEVLLKGDAALAQRLAKAYHKIDLAHRAHHGAHPARGFR